MRHMHRHLPALALYLSVFSVCLVLFALPACGPNQRQKTLHASVIAVNAARDGFLVYDRQHESEIVKKATTREEANANVAIYRTSSATVYAAILLAYNAIDIAAKANDDSSYGEAMKATATALESVKAISGGAR